MLFAGISVIIASLLHTLFVRKCNGDHINRILRNGEVRLGFLPEEILTRMYSDCKYEGNCVKSRVLDFIIKVLRRCFDPQNGVQTYGTSTVVMAMTVT